jgi:hypothetical protein
VRRRRNTKRLLSGLNQSPVLRSRRRLKNHGMRRIRLAKSLERPCG